MAYTIPVMLIGTFVLAVVRRVNLFESFTEGVKEAVELMLGLIPYLAAIFMAIELMRASGLSEYLGRLLSPVFSLLGIPKELSELLVLRPLSGSGSLILLEDIYATYGVDSRPALIASVIMGSTDTVFYIVAVYFATSKDKKTGLAIPISLICALFGTILACLLVR